MNPEAIKKSISQFQRKAKEEGINVYKLIWDFVWAYKKHRVYPDQYLNTDFYKLRDTERKKILTYGRWCKLVEKAADKYYIHFLRNKRDFNVRFAKFVKRDWIYSCDESIESIANFLERHGELIIKPLESWEGDGVRKINLNSDGKDAKDLATELKEGTYLIEQCIRNHKSLILNTSLNTVRLTTILTKNNEVIFLKPFLRAGVGDSVVDNYNSGGVEYEIDVESGIICDKGFQGGKVLHIFHPGTEIKMIGLKVPMWEQAKEIVTEAHLTIPQCKYIGWDVAITDDGVELIEGNHDAGFFGLEYYGTRRWWPVLKNLL